MPPSRRMADSGRRLYALLFHPEVAHTEHGARILELRHRSMRMHAGDWTMASFVEEATARIRRQVGAAGRVVCGLSGGVDSTVAALLVHRAVGDRLKCIFVDNGLLRLTRPLRWRSASRLACTCHWSARTPRNGS